MGTKLRQPAYNTTTYGTQQRAKPVRSNTARSKIQKKKATNPKANMANRQLEELLQEVRGLKRSFDSVQTSIVDVQRRLTNLEGSYISPSKRHREPNTSSSLELSASPTSTTPEAGSPRFMPVSHKCSICGSAVKLKSLLDHYGQCSGIEHGPASKVHRVRECLQYLRR